MVSEGFFHSFPRDKRLRTRDKSLQILRSVLHHGLLLVPEVLKYPPELRDAGDERDSIVNVQRRFSLTMLPSSQLPEHSKHFGPISLEFSSLAARRLGAIPVMYLPQAATSGAAAALDQLGYFFSYRLAELRQVCDRLLDLRNKIEQHSSSETIILRSRNGGNKLEMPNESLKYLVDMIIGDNELGDCSAALQGLSSLFYPTDEFRYSVDLVRSPLYYYYQREWRVLSGVILDGADVDLNLTGGEKQEIASCNPEFFYQAIKLRHRQTRIIDACTIIRTIDGLPVSDLIEKIFVPASWAGEAKKILEEFSMSTRLNAINIEGC